MAELILPDSNFYIDALRAGRDPFESFAINLDEREFATCGIVMLEVCRGLRSPTLLAKFRQRFSVMVILPTTPSLWERATKLAWTLEQQGRALPAQDLIIAACALSVGATVLTADGHFLSIPGLRVIDSLG